jgi:hypothetical protein
MRAYIDAKVRRQSYLFGAAAVSLMLIWVNMVPLHQGATEAATKAWEYLRSWKTYTEYQKTFSSVSNTRAKTRNQVRDLEVQIQEGRKRELSTEETKQLDALRERLKEFQPTATDLRKRYSDATTHRRRLSSKAGSKYDKLLAALDAIKVPFKISEFELPLSYRYAALAWQWFAVLGAAYLLYSRRKVLAFHAQIVRLLKPGSGSILNPATDPPAEAPFWLAPLPTRDGAHVTCDELRRWLRVGGQQTCAMAVCWGVALWFYYYAASTQAAVIIMRSARGGYEVLLSLLWAGAVGAMVCLVIAWFWPFCVEEWSDAPRPLESASRRTVLRLLLVTGIVVPMAMVGVGGIRLPRGPRQPRFRKLKRWTRATWPSGFYLNPKSRILHYLDTRHRIRGLTNRSKGHLVPYSFESEVTMERTPRVNVATFSYAYEAEALRELAAQNLQNAIELLFRAVTQDVAVGRRGHKRSLRLYDLLAGLIVRAGSADKIERLRQLLADD